MTAPLPDAAVRIAGFHSLLEGELTTLSAVAADTGVPITQLHRAAEDLDSQGALELDGEIVVGAHGLTTRSTPHSFEHRGRAVHTWCALDAVGIPAALALDSAVHTTCPTCDARLDVAVRAGKPSSDGRVVFLLTSPCSNLMRDLCSVASMFCGINHLDQWTAAHGSPSGQALSLAEAADLGRALWADVSASDE